MNTTIRNRIYSLDLLRGLVMVIMALDHTRDFFHFDAFLHDPLDGATTTPILYFTRWITHFCAPVFVFLAGISIFLQHLRKPTAELSAFLLKRGLWLLVVEFVLITFAWTFSWSFPVLIMGVIAAIGFGMVGMAAVIRLPFKMILALGLVIVLGHNILDSVPSTHQGFTWDLLRNGNFAFHPIGAGHQLAIVYPILPWLGLMMLGYCAGKLYAPDFNGAQRKRTLLAGGAGLVLLFLLLRTLNVYGDPDPRVSHTDLSRTIMSFLDVQKYPPSLLYMCMTIGPALLFLAIAEPLNDRLTQAIRVFGRVPFFYYVLHFYLLHLLGMLLFVAQGHSLSDPTPDVFGIPFRYLIIGEGYSLTVVYGIWIGLVLALYPLCRWFNAYKQHHAYWWLSYV
ncbi:MAG: DUF1624 domain-containing protein [Flavobacteriales bacterium]|nr:DUF1624 domain-containing protein [Flavobacteriales bacterium]